VGVNPFSARLPSDASVIARSRERPDEFAVIFDRHFDAVHAYLARRVGPGRAEDLASSTFAIAFERRGSFLPSADSARPWLFGIATNLLRNEWRAEQRALELIAQLSHGVVEAGGGAEVDSAGQPVSGAELVVEVLAELDPDQRDVLLLYAWEGFSYQEIAVSLGVPVGTVRSRLARARARLRSVLKDERSGPALSIDRQEMGE
jgi:RNA polymerase sigma-70 factor (ECF subfamily)